MLPLFNEDGIIVKENVRAYLTEKMPEYVTDECVNKLDQTSLNIVNNQIKESIKEFLTSYLDMNSKIRGEVSTLSLAEEYDNQAMWGLYAEESKGFCIVYSFDPKDFLRQRILLNLLPIYYGDKKEIKFFDVIIISMNNSNSINSINFEDYREWFLSTYTKNKTYEFQEEWRITFDKRMDGNLQQFPFIKSIILGERISDEYANRLIEISKRKKIPVYKRKLNKSKSNIITERIL